MDGKLIVLYGPHAQFGDEMKKDEDEVEILPPTGMDVTLSEYVNLKIIRDTKMKSKDGSKKTESKGKQKEEESRKEI